MDTCLTEFEEGLFLLLSHPVDMFTVFILNGIAFFNLCSLEEEQALNFSTTLSSVRALISISGKSKE